MNIWKRKFTISQLLALIAFVAMVSALWLTPVRFTFELHGTATRTSAGIGDLIDIQNQKLEVLVPKAKIIDYKRTGRVTQGNDVDIVTVRTTLINRIRLYFHDSFTANYYPQ